MLKSIELTNFRKHKEVEFDFEEGLNVIHCPNESGKSSLIEAIGYALYGTRATANSDFTTWGTPANSAKVSLALNQNSNEYVFSRSSRNATCGNVSGSSAVTEYAATVMGADLAKAKKLMLAPQFQLKGMLDDGQKVLREQIESLAGLDFFDDLLEKASKVLTSGNESGLVEIVAASEKSVEESKVKPLDTSELDVQIEAVSASAKEHEVTFAANNKTLDQLGTNLRELSDKLAKFNAAGDRKATAEADITKHKTRAGSLKVSVLENSIADEISKLEASLEAMREQEHMQSLYTAIDNFNAKLRVFKKGYAGDLEKVDQAVLDLVSKQKNCKLNLDSCKEAVSLIKAEIASLEGTLVEGKNCKLCGSVIVDAAAHEAHNQEVREKVAALKLKLEAGALALGEAEADLANSETIYKKLSEAQGVKQSSKQLGEQALALVDADAEGFLVYKKETAPFYAKELDTLKGRLRDLQDKQRESDVAKGKIAELLAAITDSEKVVVECETVIDALQNIPVAFEKAKKDLCDLQGVQDLLGLVCEDERNRLKDLQQTKENLEKEYAFKAAAHDKAMVVLKAHQEALSELRRNNAFIKKIRSLRPSVADSLWGIVLPSITAIYSKLRGEASSVTKAEGGFMVNGSDITSLSGSALELFGLALRIVLVKTFLPANDFLILDEPFASFDEERTKRALGMLSELGFKQIILVTHEEVSVSVADNLLQW